MNLKLLECLENYKFLNISIINDSTKTFGINAIVKKIYVINLFEDIRKRNYITMLFQKYKINYNLIVVDRISKDIHENFVNDTKITISELGCCMSHMWCLLDMLKNKHENCIIFEDDVVFAKNFIEDFLNIFKRNSKIDFLLLGAHDYNFNTTHKTKIVSGLYRPDNFMNLFGAHANFYTFKAAETMMNIRVNFLSYFDNNYALLFNLLPESYICYPNLAIANVSESSINHEKPFFSNYEIGYYSLCFDNMNLNNYNLIYTNLLNLSLMKKKDTLQKFFYRCFMNKFNDENKASLLLKRCVLDFFTVDDLKLILSDQSLIEPNTLSKK
jgi:GR25 family glycosyltransferase involved in LPS biosynthesis